MSHIVSIKTEVRDPAAVAAACRRLGLSAPVHGTARLFEGEATGLLVKLPGWLYPVVCNTATGELSFDNYNQAWGPQEQLDRFMQAYAVEFSTAAEYTPGTGWLRFTGSNSYNWMVRSVIAGSVDRAARLACIRRVLMSASDRTHRSLAVPPRLHHARRRPHPGRSGTRCHPSGGSGW